jgi:hypothetical protein
MLSTPVVAVRPPAKPGLCNFRCLRGDGRQKTYFFFFLVVFFFAAVFAFLAFFAMLPSVNPEDG